MKLKLILCLFPVLAMPLWFNSCETGEYHSVRIYERQHHYKAPTPSDDPRDFKPKERF